LTSHDWVLLVAGDQAISNF